MRKSNRSLIGLLSTSAILLPIAAHAQQAPAGGGEEASAEIVVTATRRSESIINVPYNISAISGDALAKGNITDIAGLAQRMPGIAFVDRGARDASVGSTIIIRGITTDGAGGIGPVNASANTVSVYLGETPLYTNVAIKDVSQVEVLRGPQGTLYGSSSLGGTIRFIYNRPDPDAASATVTGTAAFTRKGAPSAMADAVINLPLSDRLALRVVGGYDHEGGVVDQNSLFRRDDAENERGSLADPSDIVNSPAIIAPKKNVDYANIYYARASLRALPSDAVDVQINYQYQHNDIGGSPTINPDYNGNDWYSGSMRVTEPLDSDTHLVGLDASVDFGFATMTSSTSYYHSNVKARRDNTTLAETSPYGAFYLGSPRFIDEAREQNTERGIVQELRLASNGNAPVEYVVGAFYQNLKRRMILDDIMPGYSEWRNAEGSDPFFGGPLQPGFELPGDTNFFTDETQKFKEFALFGELTYHVTDRWQVTGGTRFFWQRFDDRAIFLLPQTEILLGDGSAEGKGRAKINDHIFKVATSYGLTDSLKAYATFSQGFRRGGANALPIVGFYAERPELNTYKPDTVDNYEIGLKGRLGRGLTFTAALFYLDWKNIQINTSTVSTAQPFVGNGGRARSQGFEFEGTARIGSNLDVTLGYAYADAKLTEAFQIRTVDINTGDLTGAISAAGFKGERTPGTPRHSLTGSIDYTQWLSNGNSILYHVDANYRSNRLRGLASDVSGVYYVPGYALANASISYQTDAWTLGAYVSNLFDAKGINAITGQTPETVSRHRGFFISRPRTVGLRLSYRFGAAADGR